MAYQVPGEHKSRTLQEMVVLQGVDLDVSKGEFCCLIGPSGCGKSTLLRIIGGLIAPTGGRVAIDGQPVVSPRPDVGVVFQSFNLLPWRTVAGNVELGLEEQGVSRTARRERARAWIARVGLDGFGRFYPGQLSGGMQQRVGLARALAIEPDILLMDEPFGSLDAQTRLLMQGDLLELWGASRKTVLFVTHDVEEALFLADRVLVMSPRPGLVIDAVDVPFERPRRDALRGDARFARIKEDLWERLKGEIVEAPATRDQPEETPEVVEEGRHDGDPSTAFGG
jgi:NitT/TauT family transport system ATP-binding protein